MSNFDAIRSAVLATLPAGVEADVCVSCDTVFVHVEIGLTKLPAGMPLRTPEYIAHYATHPYYVIFDGPRVSPQVQAILDAAMAAAKAVRPDCFVIAGLGDHLAWSDVPNKRWTGTMYVHAPG